MSFGIGGLHMLSATLMAESDSDDFICPRNIPDYLLQEQTPYPHNSLELMPRASSKKGLTLEKHLDAKTVKRLAQNREAARKSRLRKKAYVRQLESSRMKLTQLEYELQRAKHQGLLVNSGGGSGGGGGISPGAAKFDMEYARWLEENQRHLSELRTGLYFQLNDGELRVIMDRYTTHYDDIFRLKNLAVKADVLHLITGMWSTPAERCFLWIGGFRPSELIKMLVRQLDPLTEQQLMGIDSLQQSSEQAEDALSKGLQQLQQCLHETITGRPVVDGVQQQMTVALGKLASFEGFVRQADYLRQQALHQIRRILTVKQAARCFLVIGEYFARLRILSNMWASRGQELDRSSPVGGEEHICQSTTIDLQMIRPPQDHFSNF